MEIRRVGLGAQSRAVRGFCLGSAVQGAQYVAMAAVEVRGLWGQAGSLTDELLGRCVVAGLVREHAQQMERLRIARILRENLPVQRLGLRELAGLVQGCATAQEGGLVHAETRLMGAIGIRHKEAVLF